MKTLIVLLSLSVTTNAFLVASVMRSEKAAQATDKDMQSWRALAIKQDTQILMQQETLKENSETLVACLNRFGLQ